MKNKKASFIYLFLAVVGIWLLSRYWLPKGFAVAGHDSGLALNASEFLKSRLFAWDVQGFGRNNSTHFGSLMLHSVDYFWSAIAGVKYAGNQLNIFFWLFSIFGASFVLALSLKEKLGRYFIFLFPVFVTFNFYIFQSLFIVERAKYSLLVALLLILVILLRFKEKRLALVKASILTSLVLFLFNGGSWLGVPLYGSIFTAVLGFIVFELIIAIKKKSIVELTNLIKYLALTLVGFAVLNSYSILPYLSTFFSNDLQVLINEGTILQNKVWLEMISQASSFFNIFRMQGVPDWYANSVEVSPVHPYAANYVNNQWMLAISFLFPILAMLSFIIAKSKHKPLVTVFGLFTILSAFFMAGNHKPLGFLYIFLYENLPGFSLFRSPYYKFGALFFVSFSFLLAFTLSKGIEKIVSKFRDDTKLTVGVVLSIMVISSWLTFHKVYFDDDLVFSWQNFSTKFNVPEYVYEFEDWASKTDIADSRILLVPSINEAWQNDVYNWGYWSLSNLPSVLTDKSLVVNDASAGEGKMWVDTLYQLLRQGDEKQFYELSLRLGIDYLLLRKDVLSDSSWSASSSPLIFEETVDSFETLIRTETFGEWSVYKFSRESSKKIFPINSITKIPEGRLYLAQEYLKEEHTTSNSSVVDLDDFVNSELFSVQCESCPLEQKDALTSLPDVTILPNSPLYYFKEKRDQRTLDLAVSEQSERDAYLGISLRKAAEIKTMIDFGFDDRDIAAALKVLNEYLLNVDVSLQNHKEDRHYFLAKRVEDNLNVVEKNFKDYVGNQEYNRRGGTFRNEILDLLWNIYEIKKELPNS